MIQNGNSIAADKSGQFDQDVAVRMIGKSMLFEEHNDRNPGKKNRQHCSYSGWCP